MKKALVGGIVVLALGAWTGAAAQAQGTGGSALAEDLNDCKLPHGVVLLPVLGTKEAEAGNLLKLSDGSFATLPIMDADKKMLTGAQVLEKLRASRAADLQYMAEGKGTLWSISGRILELGSMYLFEASGKKFDAPMEIPGGRTEPSGMYPGISVGRTYLVQTMDIHYALVRALEKRDSGLLVEYVYQPDGTLTFDIPKSNLSPVVGIAAAGPGAGGGAGGRTASAMETRGMSPPEAVQAGAPAIPTVAPGPASRPMTVLPPPSPRPALGPGDYVGPGTIILRSGTTAGTSGTTGQESSIDNFHHQREQLVKGRMAIVEAPAHTPQEIDRKVQAINDLVMLHADEAVDLLVAQISFLNTRSTSREFSQDAWLPCLAALKQLGKPASAAAIKALRQMDMEAPGEGLDAASSKAGMMATVIRGVEGPEVGDFILRQEMEKQTDPKRRAVYEYLLQSGKKEEGRGG